MKLPITPFQKANGINGNKVVMVPVNTGKKTSLVAFFTASLTGIFSSWKIRCEFSITTIASSTTIPSASRKANNTIMLRVKPMPGKTIKAIAHDKGTDKATKMALVVPMKNIRMKVTKTKPMIMVLIKSCRVVRVLSDWSPVTTTFNSFGNSLFFMSAMI